MLEQDFDKLLAAYFEGELNDADLLRLRDAIRLTHSHRRRFQRELRLHTLMRETASVLLAQEQSKGGKLIVVGWHRIAAMAACLAACGILALLAWNYWNQPEQIGVCSHVSEGEQLFLTRHGRKVELQRNTVLCAGDRIQTAFDTETVLQVDGMGTLTLNGFSTLDLFSPDGGIGLALQQGRLLIEATKREPGTPPLVIRTPQTSTEVLGTVLGLEVESTATRVRVYEGKVRFQETRSGQAVQVAQGQYSVTGSRKLRVRDLHTLPPGALLPGQQRLYPVADAYMDTYLEAYPEIYWRTEMYTNIYLKVQGGRRTTFLKFRVQDTGQVLSARLRLTQLVDPGEGTIRFWEGSHNDWSEETLSPANAPARVRQVADRIGRVAMGQIVEVDLSSFIRKDGTYTLIISLDEPEGSDIWFGSRESPNPPELILTCQP